MLERMKLVFSRKNLGGWSNNIYIYLPDIILSHEANSKLYQTSAGCGYPPWLLNSSAEQFK